MRFGLAFFITLSSSLSQAVGIQLIGGTPAAPKAHEEVVRIIGEGSCTATLVGPRVIVTAAHCAEPGDLVDFTYKGKPYAAKIVHSALYETYNHDLAVGILPAAVTDAKPMTIAGAATEGDTLTLMGYGCTKPNGTGGNDGILRVGTTTVVDRDSLFLESFSEEDEAALCFGDSGGPAFIQTAGKLTLVGINSAGNIRDTNLNTRLDSSTSRKFLAEVEKVLSVQICGIGSTCL